jgi:hypothetical protein
MEGEKEVQGEGKLEKYKGQTFKFFPIKKVQNKHY